MRARLSVHATGAALILAAVAVAAAALVGCSGSRNLPAVAGPSVSRDATASVLGTWIARDGFTPQTLQFDPGGGVTQTLDPRVIPPGARRPRPNRGSWKVVGPDRLYFELNTLGFGVQKATYRFAATPDTLTLEHVSGDWWVTSTENPTLEFTRKK